MDQQQTHPPTDPVNHPEHYTNHPSGIECIQITEHMSFNLGNAMKYLWRADLKGRQIEDLRKAQWYIAREIDRITDGLPPIEDLFGLTAYQPIKVGEGWESGEKPEKTPANDDQKSGNRQSSTCTACEGSGTSTGMAVVTCGRCDGTGTAVQNRDWILLGLNIKAIREADDMSLGEFSRSWGIKTVDLSRIERGLGDPTELAKKMGILSDE